MSRRGLGGILARKPPAPTSQAWYNWAMPTPSPNSNSPFKGTLIHRVRKHPFGIVIIYVETLAAALAALGLIFFIAPSVIGDTSSNAFVILSGLSIFAVALMMLFLLVATYVYRQSELVLTDRNVVQVIQNGLFHRASSRLSMADIEDVTSNQRGIFATLFNYGTLTIETSGEQKNFVFNFCPGSDFFASEVLAARENFVETHPGS